MAKTVKNYKALLSKTNEQVQTEQLDFTVQQAEVAFSQGLLNVQGKMITAECEVKKAESNVKTAEKSLETAKSSKPEVLVQNIVNAKIAVKQANLDLEAAKEAHNQLKEMYEFLETTKKELFS